jgi:hypothetical protein
MEIRSSDLASERRCTVKAAKGILTGLILLLASSTLTASGPIGIYGIVEKVVFEPNEQSPERIQIWGTFAHADGDVGTAIPQRPLATGAIRRGYLYFRLPATGIDTVRKEWRDLKTVAGTGQAIGFGSWIYVGAFGAISPDRQSESYHREGGKVSGVLPAGTPA